MERGRRPSGSKLLQHETKHVVLTQTSSVGPEVLSLQKPSPRVAVLCGDSLILFILIHP